MNSWFWILVSLLVFAGIGWLVYDSLRPLPGQAVADLGRQHVAPGIKVDYNSNPPTSGNHYPDWIRKGVYSEPKDDGNLVHSLEHGYVVISYSCEITNSKLKTQDSKLEATESAEATGSMSITREEWQSQECKDLVAKLTDVYKKKGQDRLIVVPRPSLDTRIALTAWARIDKFDDFDEKRITGFIDAFRNRGPEKTVE